MRDEISFLDRICFVSDPDLARSFENKKHFFIHMMVVKGECALPRWDHGHVVSELLRADFSANLSKAGAIGSAPRVKARSKKDKRGDPFPKWWTSSGLGLQSKADWFRWVGSGQRPDDIPANPSD